MKTILKKCSALVAVASLFQPMFIVPVRAQTTGYVTLQPLNNGSAVSQYQIANEPTLSTAQMTTLIRKNVKYVFVLFNENNSFDHEFGTFPGVNGLYYDGQGNTRVAPNTTQQYYDVNGASFTVTPFQIGPAQNSTFADSTDHSHTGLAAKLLGYSGNNSSAANPVTPKTNAAPISMSGFAQDEYNRYAGTSANPGSVNAQKEGSQFARLVMSHVDCNTIPFFWQYANRFTIFDNIFATEDTPSSPNAIAMIAGQAGETQWVLHGARPVTSGQEAGTTYSDSLSYSTTTADSATVTQTSATYSAAVAPSGSGNPSPNQLPLVNDPQPYWGSVFDTTTVGKQPESPKESWSPANTSINLTFANVLLTLGGPNVTTLMSGDRNAAVDQADIASDIPAIQSHGAVAADWRWYQNGYDAEPNEPNITGLGGTQEVANLNYVSHHQGPQYFGYLANNPNETPKMRGENDFFTDITNITTSMPNGGAVYIRGGYYNTKGQLPPIQNANYPDTAGLTTQEQNVINFTKAGDDDHPSYSDKQLSEAMNARIINAIASNPTLWAESAIIITYDESDGLFDHVPPQILSYGPDSLPLARGIRIPLILISPYARAGAVSHAEGDHNAIIETINAIFNLPALSSLPAEKGALAAGNSAAFNQFGPAGFQQTYLGPRDTPSAITDSLLSGFSPLRLLGQKPVLPASYVTIPDGTVESFPHFNGNGCSTINVTPTDANMVNTIPGTGSTSGAPNAWSPGPFNTLPSTLPAYN